MPLGGPPPRIVPSPKSYWSSGTFAGEQLPGNQLIRVKLLSSCEKLLVSISVNLSIRLRVRTCTVARGSRGWLGAPLEDYTRENLKRALHDLQLESV